MKYIKEYNENRSEEYQTETLNNLSEYLQEFFDRNDIRYKKHKRMNFDLYAVSRTQELYWDIISRCILIYTLGVIPRETYKKLIFDLTMMKDNLESRIHDKILFSFTSVGLQIYLKDSW